jgi:biopolymer transport protein TolQ
MLANAIQFAFDRATFEGKITVAALVVVSLFSWTVIVNKVLQFARASRMSRQFYAAFRETSDPLELSRQGKTFDGAPAFALYMAAVDELDRCLTRQRASTGNGEKLAPTAFDFVHNTIEEAAIGESMVLEKGMIVLSTAVAGGPFIGLLGTVWGVMDTFAGIARANAASLTAMAPGVAGALIATVIGLLVAIPAMFAYNFLVTRMRMFTQELDSFAIRLATQIEYFYVEKPA